MKPGRDILLSVPGFIYSLKMVMDQMKSILSLLLHPLFNLQLLKLIFFDHF